MSAIATVTAPAELSTKQRWGKAVREIRKAGVAIKHNVRGCCRGCIDIREALGLTDEYDGAWAYSYGGQGCATRWDNDTMMYLASDRYRKTNTVEKVYFNHGNGAASVLVEIFRANGFTVDWDGAQSQCVEVSPNS